MRAVQFRAAAGGGGTGGAGGWWVQAATRERGSSVDYAEKIKQMHARGGGRRRASLDASLTAMKMVAAASAKQADAKAKQAAMGATTEEGEEGEEEEEEDPESEPDPEPEPFRGGHTTRPPRGERGVTVEAEAEVPEAVLRDSW